MKLLIRAGIATCAAACVMMAGAGRAFAENGYWEPPNIHPAASVPLAAVLAKARARSGLDEATSERSERWTVSAAGFTFPARVTLRGDDFVVRSVLDGETYASGRRNGFHWRSTPRGLVHVVQSDVQGDDLDRWPTALLPLSAQCAFAGEMRTAGGAEWVLVDRREHDMPHWFFIDEATGSIVREVTREGRRVETTTFDDFRTANGTTRPFHWRTQGPGGDLAVQVSAVEAHSIDEASVEIPLSVRDTFTAPDRAEAVRAQFTGDRFNVRLRISGKLKTFLLDTGTPEILISTALARQFHLHVALGHAVLPEIAIGSSIARSAPVGVIDGTFDGILGYEFFSGRIVHFSYARGSLEMLPRSAFTPPAGAHQIESSFEEGMPIVTAIVGRAVGERFVLDTGSSSVVMLTYLLLHGHYSFSDLDANVSGESRPTSYLEGRIETADAELRKVNFGFGTFDVRQAQVQSKTELGDAEFPIDGIIGTDFLGHFEWWFDADSGLAWVRRET